MILDADEHDGVASTAEQPPIQDEGVKEFQLSFLALVFIVVSIPVATRGIVFTSILMALGRAVIGAFLLFSGIFMVATVARSLS